MFVVFYLYLLIASLLPDGRRTRGRPRKQWLDYVEVDLCGPWESTDGEWWQEIKKIQALWGTE